MKIKIWIADDMGNIIKNLGECATDSPTRALQMYEDDLAKIENDGVIADLCWAEVK